MKDCDLYPTQYDNIFVTKEGQVFSVKEIGSETANGYIKIMPYKDGKKLRSKLAHRLVLETFKGPSQRYCNHKNGNKSDNRIENLEWVTASENVKHAIKDLKVHPAYKKMDQSHCVNGHEFTLENVYRDPQSGTRKCRACRNERSRKKKQEGRYEKSRS